MDHVRQLCDRLKEYGMAVGEDKCLLRVTSLEFLGHNENGIIPMPKKVQGITAFKAPTNQKETLRYLGMLNYYRQSLPKIAAVLQPLHPAATKKLEKGEKFTWTTELQKALDVSN